MEKGGFTLAPRSRQGYLGRTSPSCSRLMKPTRVGRSGARSMPQTYCRLQSATP